LLEAARALFYSRGIGITGVEDVAAASGLTKPTLYRHFPSKETLVASYLKERHDQLDLELRTWLQAASPTERPQAVVEWLCDWLARAEFNGCAFVRALAELPADQHIRAMARRRKRSLRQRIEEACEDAEVVDSKRLARQLALIVEGATTLTFVNRNEIAAMVTTARGLADLALEEAGLKRSSHA
jgi:AcrR family transcriptional regulator